MQSKHGPGTGLFGEWLTAYLKNYPKYSRYRVYYDHGDPQIHPNVVAITGFYGNTPSRYNMLTQVDVLVINPEGEISLVFEIEERSSAPKKIIGDVFTNLMCNSYSINLSGKTHYFKITPETQLVVAGIVDTHGSKLKQLDEVIVPRLKAFESPKDSIDEKNARLILKENMDNLIAVLKDTAKTLFP